MKVKGLYILVGTVKGKYRDFMSLSQSLEDVEYVLKDMQNKQDVIRHRLIHIPAKPYSYECYGPENIRIIYNDHNNDGNFFDFDNDFSAVCAYIDTAQDEINEMNKTNPGNWKQTNVLTGTVFADCMYPIRSYNGDYKDNNYYQY